MNNFNNMGDEDLQAIAEMDLSGDEIQILDQVRGVLDSLEDMPSEIKFFFDTRYDDLLSEVPAGMVKRIWALMTIRDIKNEPDCDGIAVAIRNFYKVMRAYNRKAAKEFLEMISIQANDDEEQINNDL